MLVHRFIFTLSLLTGLPSAFSAPVSNVEQLEYSKSFTASASSLEVIPSAASASVTTLAVPTSSNTSDKPPTSSSQKEQVGGLAENDAEPIADLLGNPRFQFGGSECKHTFLCF